MFDNLSFNLTSGTRLISLDAFRGLTIAGMILVNDPGSWSYIYAPLKHAEWNGITPTDLVFPFFIFIVGVSIALVYTKRLESGASVKDQYSKLIVRSFLIFAFGAFLHFYPKFFSFSANPYIDLLQKIATISAIYAALIIWKSNYNFRDQSTTVKAIFILVLIAGIGTLIFCYDKFVFSEFRLVGVLTRIAIVYFVCSILFLNSNWKTQAFIGTVILLAYWIVMYTIPVPGEGKVMLEPGKNIAAWLDSILVPGKMFQCSWDPEGFLSTFPSIVTGISGMLVGKLLTSRISSEHKLIWLFAAGFLSFLIGGMWDWFFPINKNLWTSSFVMYTSGAATMGLAASILFVDIMGYKKWTRFGVVFGSNALAAYLLHGLISSIFHINFGESTDPVTIKSAYFQGLVSLGLTKELVSLIWAVLYVLICYIPIRYLYLKKIYIKV